jgi:hypothetical protein
MTALPAHRSKKRLANKGLERQRRRKKGLKKKEKKFQPVHQYYIILSVLNAVILSVK